MSFFLIILIACHGKPDYINRDSALLKVTIRLAN